MINQGKFKLSLLPLTNIIFYYNIFLLIKKYTILVLIKYQVCIRFYSKYSLEYHPSEFHFEIDQVKSLKRELDSKIKFPLPQPIEYDFYYNKCLLIKQYTISVLIKCETCIRFYSELFLEMIQSRRISFDKWDPNHWSDSNWIDHRCQHDSTNIYETHEEKDNTNRNFQETESVDVTLVAEFRKLIGRAVGEAIHNALRRRENGSECLFW